MHRLLLTLCVLAGLCAAQTLNPKVQASMPAAAGAAELRADFADPPAEYRSMPLWVWNDELEWPRLKEQLEQFKKQGIGGVFVHPRPGLMTEYLGPDWFRLWKLAVEEGKRLGITVNIYDENSYPSGFSGGYVPSKAPDTAAQYVQADMNASPAAIGRGALAFFAIVNGAAGEVKSARLVRSASEVPAGAKVVAFRLRRASGNPWTGGFPYVDLTNPATTPAFLETTYELYKKHLGPEFGKTVRWAFTDEPLLATAGAYDSAALALPLSFNTLAEFRKRNGYDLADELPSLFWDVGEYRKVRFDYWQTVHDLWKENFMRPMFEWCDRNGLEFTGHWMEHEWPYPWISPADGSLYAFEHVPGIDLLEGTNLRLTGKDPHMLFTIKQVASVSHQLGRRAFTEAYGVAGWDGTLEHYKRFGDWLMVHGINFIDQHLAFSTVRGARKRDHPQSFSDISAWWPEYRLHADHLARVSGISSRSEARNRLLILQQTTSGFLEARRGGATPELEGMQVRNAEMNQFLADRQMDYDLGDEYMIEWFGRQDGRRFVIGKAAYDLLVVPPDMSNVRSQTLPHLERYLAAGGTILALCAPPAYVDGRPSDRVAQLTRKYSAQWRRVDSLDALAAGVRERLAPRITFAEELPSGVGFMERFLPDGDRVVFLTNSGLKPVKTRATLAGGSIEEWDTVAGRTAPARYSAAGGKLSFDLELAPAASRLLLVRQAAGPADTAPQAVFSAVTSGAWRIGTDAPNVLVLDYCDLKTAVGVEENLNTWRANWKVWQLHGFERPAWDNAVQFQQRIFDRNHFAKDSGFEATFRFEADAAALAGLELAVETPELYRIELNGNLVDFKAGSRWLDPHIRSVRVDKLAKAGENTVRVVGQPFDVRMELENIYLRGSFAVQPAARGYRLTGPSKLSFGSWQQQGYRFYSDAVTYETEVTVPAGSRKLRVELGDWAGSAAVVLLDGKKVATLPWQPFRAEFAAEPGRHTLAVRVISTPRNLFGPFHNPAKPRMRAWPGAWADFPERQPAGGAYDLIDYGLNAPPAIAAAP